MMKHNIILFKRNIVYMMKMTMKLNCVGGRGVRGSNEAVRKSS